MLSLGLRHLEVFDTSVDLSHILCFQGREHAQKLQVAEVALCQMGIVIACILLGAVVCHHDALNLLHLIDLVHLQHMFVHYFAQTRLIRAGEVPVLRQVQDVKHLL